MGTCGASKEAPLPDFDLNFDAPEIADEEERKIHQLVAEVLEQAGPNLEAVKDYGGCEDVIRKALNDPNPKTEEAAWKTVSKAVEKLHSFYQFSLSLENVWPKLLDCVCLEDSVAGVSSHLALTKQLGQIFDFVFHFDEAKMVNPAIQNDFSYYRRVLGRMKTKGDKKEKVIVDEELANKMSFFFAYPTPMMKVLIDATTAFDKNQKHRVIGGLSLVSNACLKALEEDGGESKEEKTMLFLCAMTGCVILVDHLHDEGAFHAKSPIRIRGCISKLKSHELPTDFLLNSLKFTTLHLNDEQTMPAITKLLA